MLTEYSLCCFSVKNLDAFINTMSRIVYLVKFVIAALNAYSLFLDRARMAIFDVLMLEIPNELVFDGLFSR